MVTERAGLGFHFSSRDRLEESIQRAMTRANTSELPRYVQLLQIRDDLLEDLIDELTIAETYFFRDPQHFDLVRETVLPEVRKRRGLDHVFRAWSAGCCSGEELYSLAILLSEEGLAQKSHLLGTDVSRRSLARAAVGVYSDWSVNRQGKLNKESHLVPDKDGYHVGAELKSRVTFRYQNLLLDQAPSFVAGTWGMDLIFCRNVLIYFNSGAVKRVGRHLFDCLSEGGWLITGPSDPNLSDAAPFERMTTPFGFVYRKGHPSVARMSPQGRPPSQPPREPAAWAPASPSSAPVAKPEAVPALEQATSASARADYAAVVGLRKELENTSVGSVLLVRALANLEGSAVALGALKRLLEQHPLHTELHHLQAVLQMDLDRYRDAADTASRMVYLDRHGVVAWFTLGTALQKLGDAKGSRRAYDNAQKLASKLPPDQLVPLSDGESAGRLRVAALGQLALLDSNVEVNREG